MAPQGSAWANELAAFAREVGQASQGDHGGMAQVEILVGIGAQEFEQRGGCHGGAQGTERLCGEEANAGVGVVEQNRDPRDSGRDFE